MGEIQAIIRQITASVTFLPMLEDKCTFDLLVYTKADSAVPQQWCVSSPLTHGGLARTTNNECVDDERSAHHFGRGRTEVPFARSQAVSWIRRVLTHHPQLKCPRSV
jgi:hypothetical protein